MSLDLSFITALDKIVANNPTVGIPAVAISVPSVPISTVPSIAVPSIPTSSVPSIPTSSIAAPSVTHPFLKSNSIPPNGGELVENLSQLEEKKSNYQEALKVAGLKGPEVPVDISNIKFNFNLDTLVNQIRTELFTKISVNSEWDGKPIQPPNTNGSLGASLIDQSWTLLDIVAKACPPSWEPVFEESKEDLKRINQFLMEIEASGRMWYPLKADLFRVFYLLKVHNVKCIIWGQDPYPGTNKSTGLPIAMGISFGTHKGNPIPASLVNMYKRLAATVPGFVYPAHADLTSWVEQGVLLVNKCLTLDPGNPNSHKDLWSEFTTRVIQYIDKVNPNCVYVLLGNHAQQLARYTTSKNIVMTSHPSGQGAHYGFNTSDIFNDVNKILVNQGKTPIDWNVK